MRCSISGEEAIDPVVSPRSGSIFERKHITNYIEANGKDPINDLPLAIEDLVSIKSDAELIVPPQQPNLTSIPALLTNLQNEWDALALEVFTLRKQLFSAREELSSALYQYDAAVRVAARALKERDEARDALRELSVAIADGSDASEEPNGLSVDVEKTIPIDDLNEAKVQLFELHKSQKLSNPLGNSTKANLTESELPIADLENAKRVITNGYIVSYVDKTAIVQQYDDEKNKETKTFQANVNACDISADSSLVVVHDNNITSNKDTTPVKGKDIIEIKCHPLIPQLFVGLTKTWWGLYDTRKGLLFQSPESTASYTTISFHVDGLLIAVGTDTSLIEIYSLADGKLASTFSTKYESVKKIQFGLNGYWMILLSETTDSNESCIEIFDLRKNSTIHSIDVHEHVSDFSVDSSSSLIAIASSSLYLHSYVKKGKKWITIDAENTWSNLDQIMFAPYEPKVPLRIIGTGSSNYMIEVQTK